MKGRIGAVGRTFALAGVLAGLAVSGVACKDEPGNAHDKAPAPKPGPPPNAVQPPIPYTKHIACAQLLDAAKLKDALGKEVTIEDQTENDNDAAAICGIKLGGKPPSEAEQKRKFKENDMVLGILPGDELCTIRVIGWTPMNAKDQEAMCAQAKGQASHDLGDFTCVRQFEAADKYRYEYWVLDPDTKCKYVVNGGPSVTDQQQVMACAKAAIDTIGPENIKVQ